MTREPSVATKNAVEKAERTNVGADTQHAYLLTGRSCDICGSRVGLRRN